LQGLRHFRLEIDVPREAGRIRELWRKVARRNSPSAILGRLTIHLEVLLHFAFVTEEMLASPLPEGIRPLAEEWSQGARQALQDFYRAYPHYSAAVQSFFIANTIRARSSKAVQQLFDATIISGAVRSKASRKIEAAHRQAEIEAKGLLRPTRAYLVSRVPMFKNLPKLTIKKIAEFSKVVLLEPGSAVFAEGDEGHSFFIVAAGLLEVSHSRLASHEGRPRLFTGDFFGELSLLFDQPRAATVRALMTTELLELDQKTFEFILMEYPSLKKSIYEAAQARRAASEGTA
jgi:hypothetical protein